MTTRDRLMAMGLVAAAIVLAAWFLVVSPERKHASKLAEQVNTAQQQLTAAQEKLRGAQAARTQYETAYASVVRLGEAVPPTDQVPALVYQLDQLSNSKDVNFQAVTSSPSGSGSSSSSSTASAASASFKQMPFTFTFDGSFFALNHLLENLQGLTVQSEKGDLKINGRLLTIQSVALTPGTGGSESKSGKSGQSSEPELSGVVTATAYVLPAGEALTAGATPAGPAGAAGAQTTSTSATGSTAAPPAAVAKVTP